MMITPSGQVRIGTTTPSSSLKLTVAGEVVANAVKVLDATSLDSKGGTLHQFQRQRRVDGWDHGHFRIRRDDCKNYPHDEHDREQPADHIQNRCRGDS
jgi:hypothetical protein